MSLIVSRAARIRQPPGFVRIAPAWQSRVVACILPSSRLDVVNGGLALSGTAPGITVTDYGIANQANGSGLLYSLFPAGAVPSVVGTTLLTAGYRNTSATAFHAAAGENASSGGFFAVESNGTANIYYRVRTVAGSGISDFDSSDVTVRGTANCVTAFRLTGLSSATCSINGVDAGGRLVGSGATGVPAWSRFSVCGLMRDTASYATSGSSRYALAALLVGLTQADERTLSNNPWQIFAPQERRIWVAVPSGAVFNAAWARGSNSIIGHAP